MNFQSISQTLFVWLAAFGFRSWAQSRFGSSVAGSSTSPFGLVTKALRKRPIEPTVVKYLGSTVSVLLNFTLVIAILGYFGVQTTTFAALLASAGLAICLAWSGLLANTTGRSTSIRIGQFAKHLPRQDFRRLDSTCQ